MIKPPPVYQTPTGELVHPSKPETNPDERRNEHSKWYVTAPLLSSRKCISWQGYEQGRKDERADLLDGIERELIALKDETYITFETVDACVEIIRKHRGK